MEALPTALYTPAQAAELDRLAMTEHGLGDGRLMARAGEAAFRVLRRRWPGATRLVVLCGGGNNGGDGYVIARLAHEAGLGVRVIALSDPTRLTGDARDAMLACQDVLTVETAEQGFEPGVLADAELIVDALLGTGLDRAVHGRYAEAIEAMNAAMAPVIAVDVPSGLSADTGGCLGVAVRAALTVTFIGLKRGLLTADAPAYCGELIFADLRVPATVYAAISPAAERMTAQGVALALPRRPRTAHKGHYGRVLVAGGDFGMGGAVTMAAAAAVRAGAGLISAVTRPEHVPAILAQRPEVMCRGVAEPSCGHDLAGQAQVLALGPGLGRGDWGRSLYQRLQGFAGPQVLDADGLALLAEAPDYRDNRIITPHPGEAAMLLGERVASVQADRFAAIRRLVERFGGVVVLKGAGTLISDGPTSNLNDTGNPGMATGGMGDVLTGLIAGLLAQGLAPLTAASVGVWLHGSAADQVASSDGERGMAASDLLGALRTLVNP